MWNWFRRILAEQALKKYGDFIRTLPGIKNVSVSLARITDGKIIFEPCLRIEVARKLETVRLIPSELFSYHFSQWKQGQVLFGHIQIPSKLFGARTDIVSFPKGIKPIARFSRQKQIVPKFEPYERFGNPRGIDTKAYDEMSGGIAMSGTTIAAQGLGTCNIIAQFKDDAADEASIINNFHVARKGDKLFQPMITRPIGVPVISDVRPPAGDWSRGRGKINGNPPFKLGYIYGCPNGEIKGWEPPQLGMRIGKRGITKYGNADFYMEGTVTSRMDRIDVDYSEVGVPVNYVEPKHGVWEFLSDDPNAPFGGAGNSGSGPFNLATNKICLIFTWGGEDEAGVVHCFGQSWEEIVDALGEPSFHQSGNGDGGGNGKEPTCEEQDIACTNEAMKEPDFFTMLYKALLCFFGYFDCKFTRAALQRKINKTLGSKLSRTKVMTFSDLGIELSITIKKSKR